MTLQNPPAGYPVMSGIILTTLITAIVRSAAAPCRSVSNRPLTRTRSPR